MAKTGADGKVEPVEKNGKAPQLADDEEFERRYKGFQRLGWGFLILFLFAAALGFLGSGFYSSRTARAPSFWVNYDRVLHQESPSQLRIHFSRLSEASEVKVHLNQTYLRKVSIEKITPEPSQAEVTEAGVTWSFLAESNSVSGEISFSIRPEQTGSAKAELKLGRESVAFTQLIMP